LKPVEFTCTYCLVPPAFIPDIIGDRDERIPADFSQVTLCGWVAMAFLRSFAFPDFLDTLVSLSAAFVLGTLIGAERQYRQRGGGLRTHVLVAIGAATFVDIGMRINGNPGATQIIAYVVSGVGFLGAGVIMKQGSNVWGLNTAATLWCSAAVGACAGADLAIEAVTLTIFVLAGNTLLRPLVNAINRAPIDEAGTEAIYEVHLRTSHEHRDDATEFLRSQLEAANYPVKDIEDESEKEDEVELVATLLGTAADPDELDAVVARLKANPIVASAGWDLRTTE
jgi:putative Mg2+ transporter-C (MgtC) family protein